jgi:HSP20 family protein
MTNTQVETRKAPPARSPAPDVWQAFRGDMDRLFDRFTAGSGLPSFRRMFDLEPSWRYESSFGIDVPAVDVTETATAYKIAAELPGMSEKDVDISVTGDVIVMKGEKRQEREDKAENRYFSERSYGAFQRSFTLPDGVDRDKIGAEFAKGVLTLTLPKTVVAQKQQRRIDVKAA